MENSLRFDLPKENSSIIKVIGVGGGGSNAVNYMYEQGIKGVDFIVSKTGWIRDSGGCIVMMLKGDQGIRTAAPVICPRRRWSRASLARCRG